MRIERATPIVRPQMRNKKKGFPTYEQNKNKQENKQEQDETKNNQRPTETNGNKIIMKI